MGGSNSKNTHKPVSFGEWWIDDDGSWRGGPRLSIASAGSDLDSRWEAECGALFHLGMANIRLTSNRVHVRWSVQHVETEALRTVRDFLAQLKAPPRIVLDYYYGAWERIWFSDPNDACACLDVASAHKETIPMGRPFVRRMAIDDPTASLPTMRRALTAWEKAEGHFSLTEDNPLTPFRERVLAFAPNIREDAFVYDHMGTQAALVRFKGQAWADQVHGKTCGQGVEQDSPSNAITEPYTQVLVSGTPRLDHIRARISRFNREAEWVTYQRLLMPAHGDRGEPLVLCLSARTPQIEIPDFRNSVLDKSPLRRGTPPATT